MVFVYLMWMIGFVFCMFFFLINVEFVGEVCFLNDIFREYNREVRFYFDVRKFV